MDLDDEGRHVRFLVHDRDGKFPILFDAVLVDAAIQVVLTGARILRMNAVMERWIQSCRRELLDRTLIWNQPHLLYALREYERFYNTHRPTRATTTPDRYNRCHSQPPTKQPSPDSTPPTTTTGRHPQRVPPRRLTCTDDIFGKHRADTCYGGKAFG